VVRCFPLSSLTALYMLHTMPVGSLLLARRSWQKSRSASLNARVHGTKCVMLLHCITKKTENTPCTSLTTLPVPLTRHTGTLGWQPSSVTPDTPSQTVCRECQCVTFFSLLFFLKKNDEEEQSIRI
jgi:hypothetical protein